MAFEGGGGNKVVNVLTIFLDGRAAAGVDVIGYRRGCCG